MGQPPLTAAKIRNIQPDPERRREYPMGAGLYLVVQPSGAKSWACRFRADGRPIKVTLGEVLDLRIGEREPAAVARIGGALTLGQARKLCGDVQHKAARGEQTLTPRRERSAREHLTAGLFEVVAAEFLLRHARPNTRESSFCETARSLGFRLDESASLVPRAASERIRTLPSLSWRGRPIDSITKRDVNELLNATADERGGHAANATLAAVRRLFNWAVEQDLLTTSPCLGVKRRLQSVERERVLDDSELTDIWSASHRLGWPFGHLIRLLILTGCRRDEWAQAKWSEISLSNATFTIPAERSKNGHSHIVPLSATAIQLLGEAATHRLLGEPDWVFSTGYGRSALSASPTLVPISGFSKAKRQIDESIVAARGKRSAASGDSINTAQILEAWRLHDLRRTFVTGLGALSVPLEVIEKAVNHISGTFSGVVRVYQRHKFATEVRDAMSRWDQHISSIVTRDDT